MTKPCPRCDSPLARVVHGRITSWRCQTCGGMAATRPALQQVVRPDTLKELWRLASEATLATGPACPGCRRRMTATQLALPHGGEVELDVCRPCTFVWLDGGELARLPRQAERPAAPPHISELPAEARDALLALQLASERNRTSKRSDRQGVGMLAYGLADIDRLTPTEQGEGVGIVTAATTALVALASVAALIWADETQWIVGAQDDGLQPYGKVWWYGLLAVHGNVYWILGALWYLFSFGRLVERRLGMRWMAALVAATAAAGTLATAVGWAPHESVPGVLAVVASLVTFATLVDPGAEMAIPVWLPISRRFSALHMPLWLWSAGGALWWVWWYGFVLQSTASRVLISPIPVGAVLGLVVWQLWRRRGTEGKDAD